MDAQIQDFKKLLNDSKKILIVLPAIINTDVISSCLALFHMFSTVMKKETMIGSSVEIPLRFKRLCDEFGVEEKYLLKELKGLRYVFSFPEVGEDMNIDLKRVEGKVELSLMPTDGGVDPSMMEFMVEGDKFDLVITVGAKSFNALGPIYKKDLFETFKIVNLDTNKLNDEFGDLNLLKEKVSTVSEVVLAVYKGVGVKIDDKVADILSRGMIAGSKVFKNMSNDKVFERIMELAEHTKMREVINEYLYSLSIQGLKLRREMFVNMQINEEAGFAWSKLLPHHFHEINIEPTSLHGIDYLPFDVARDIKNTAIIYDDGEGRARAFVTGGVEKIKSDEFTIYKNGDVAEIIADTNVDRLENFIKETFGVKSIPQQVVMNKGVSPINSPITQQKLPARPATVQSSLPQEAKSDAVKPPFQRAEYKPEEPDEKVQTFGPKPPFTKATSL